MIVDAAQKTGRVTMKIGFIGLGQRGGAARNVLGVAKALGFGDHMVPEMADWIAELFKK